MPAFASDHGFTLLETLVAFFILALATTMFAVSVSAGSSQVSGAEQLINASILGARLMAETDAKSSGSVEAFDEAVNLKWRRSAAFAHSQAGGNPIMLVTVEIYRSGGQPPLLQLHSAIIVPAQP